jgi:hypothetical protein
MPSAFFVGIVVSLRLNVQLSSAKAGEALLTSPPENPGAIRHLQQGEADTTNLPDIVGKMIPHKVANEVS